MPDKPEGEKKIEPVAPKAQPNMTSLLLVVVIGLLLVVIVGGALATVMVYRSSGHAADSAQTEEVAQTENSESGEKAPMKPKPGKPGAVSKDGKDKGPKASAIYVTLEPPFVVNFAAGRPAKFLQISMEIMTRDPSTAQLLKENNPLVRNDLLMLFGSQDYDAVATSDGREALRLKALDAARGVVKKEAGKPTEVEAVYFTSLVMQ